MSSKMSNFTIELSVTRLHPGCQISKLKRQPIVYILILSKNAGHDMKKIEISVNNIVLNIAHIVVLNDKIAEWKYLIILFLFDIKDLNSLIFI